MKAISDNIKKTNAIIDREAVFIGVQVRSSHTAAHLVWQVSKPDATAAAISGTSESFGNLTGRSLSTVRGARVSTTSPQQTLAQRCR